MVIPKMVKDFCLLKYLCPVIPLNVNYKILTKLLSTRPQEILKNIVNPDQIGYLARRFISENIRTTADILTYCKLYNKSAYITLIDFEKAFDSVRWSFFVKCLKAFNFSDSFISLDKIFYSNTVV